MLTTLESLKDTAERSLPTVIAAPLNRCRILTTEDVGGRLKKLLDLAELVVKFSCIVSLQELRVLLPDLRDQLPRGDKSLEFLRSPSFGAWIGLMRDLSKISLDDSNSVWCSPILASWQTLNIELRPIKKALAATIQLPAIARGPDSPAELCAILVAVRNKHAHRPIEATEVIVDVEAAVVALIQSMAPAFEQMVLFQPTRQEFSREGLYKAQATMLIGSFPEENRSIELTAPLEFDEIYLTDNERKVEPLRLAPFLLWQRSDSSNQFETYVYNEAWNSKLVYVSHASGDHYYHTELHHGFEQLVKLQLSPGIEEDRFNDLSPAQREEAADTYFKRAVHSRQKGHLEAAIVELEASAEYVRHYQTFLEMARVLMELGDYSAAALRIESCLDMSPNDPSALQLAEDMRNIDNREQPIPPPSPESDQEDLPHPTLFHAITPKGFQYYSVLWCMGIFMIWYVPSIVLEIAYVNLQSGLAIFGLLLCCTLHVVGFAGTRQRLLDARTPLSLQVNERIERFDAFFDTNMSATFGRWHQLSTERKFFVGCAIWTVCVATISVAITSLHLPSALILKRWVDFAILDALMFYQARGIIGLTRAVWLYSQRSLKPFLSRVTDGGLRAFGPPVTYAVGLACVWWIIYWSAASILVHTEHWVDLLLLFIGTGLFIIWSLGLPLALYRSALASKSNAGADYAQHLQTAFAAFIKEPDQARLERYQWLLKQQAVIGKTPVWPLTLSQTVIVALVSNAILLSTDLLYIVNRFSISLSELARLVGLR